MILVSLFIWIHQKPILQTSDEKSSNIVESMQLNASNIPLSKMSLHSKQEESAASKAANNIQEYRTLMGNAAAVAEVEGWFAKHGNYAFNDGNAAYKSYNKETLEKLASTGDLRAIHALALLYEKPPYIGEYGAEGYIAQYSRAATYGSTAALTDLAIAHEVRFYDYERDNSVKKIAAIEVLALYGVSELRGDSWANINDGELFRERLTRDNIFLGKSDQDLIAQRSKQIYDQLQQERTALGLGEFDNSTPDSVKQFYNRLKSAK